MRGDDLPLGLDHRVGRVAAGVRDAVRVRGGGAAPDPGGLPPHAAGGVARQPGVAVPAASRASRSQGRGTMRRLRVRSHRQRQRRVPGVRGGGGGENRDGDMTRGENRSPHRPVPNNKNVPFFAFFARGSYSISLRIELNCKRHFVGHHIPRSERNVRSTESNFSVHKSTVKSKHV